LCYVQLKRWTLQLVQEDDISTHVTESEEMTSFCGESTKGTGNLLEACIIL